MAASGQHVGPPRETPKSPQSREHVFGPETKTTAQPLTRQETMRNFRFLQNANIFSPIVHVFEQSSSNWNQCVELEQSPFVPSDVQIHIDLEDFEDLGKATSIQSCFNQAQPTSNNSNSCNCFFLGYFLRIFPPLFKSTFLLLLVTKHPNSWL